MQPTVVEKYSWQEEQPTWAMEYGAVSRDADPPDSVLSAVCVASQALRIALWRGIQIHSTTRGILWKKIRCGDATLREVPEESLKYYARRCGMLGKPVFAQNGFDGLGGSMNKRPRPGRQDDEETRAAKVRVEAEGVLQGPDADYDYEGPDGASFVIRESQYDTSDKTEEAEGTGFLRREQVDRSAADARAKLLELTSIHAAAPLRLLCSERACAAILEPSDTSCWCRGCSVFRCLPCSEAHRRSQAGSFHVTEVWDPILGCKSVQRACIGEDSFYLPGLDFCENCGHDVDVSEYRDVTLISDVFGVECVHVPKSQTCRGCCRVHDATDILFTRYRFEPQTSIRPETFYDRSMLNSIMQRQVTSMELEATSLNRSIQDKGLRDGVDDRGLGSAYWSYYERRMSEKEKYYVESISRKPEGVHYPTCPCCTAWVLNEDGTWSIKYHQGMILVEDGNFKVKHLLQCKSLYEQKLPLILYEDDPVVL